MQRSAKMPVARKIVDRKMLTGSRPKMPQNQAQGKDVGMTQAPIRRKIKRKEISFSKIMDRKTLAVNTKQAQRRRRIKHTQGKS